MVIGIDLGFFLFVCMLFATDTAARDQKTVEQVFVASRVSFQGWNHQPIQPRIDVEPDPKFDSRTSQVISKNVLQLAQNIGRSLLSNSNKKSEVFSPLSIYGALSLLLMGAKGPTYNELINLLKFNEDPYLATNPYKIHEEFGLMLEDIERDFPNPRHKRPSYFWQINRQVLSNPVVRRKPDPEEPQKIYVANGLFVQNGYSIRPDYRDAVLGVYHSTLKNLDFTRSRGEATRYINDWVDEKTNGKIKNIISENLPPETKIIMASALYFKATWERKFVEGGTQPRDFYPNGIDEPPVTVEMMAHGGVFPFYDSIEYDCRIIGLPYQKNLTTMYIIVPNNSNRRRLQQFQAQLTADKIENMISKMEWKTAILLFPKLHIENKFDLDDVLQQMGVSSLFDNRRSDLSLISTGEEILNAWLPSLSNGNSIANAFLPVGSISRNGSSPRYPGAETEQNDSLFLFSSRFGEENENDAITTTTEDSTTILTTFPSKSKQENSTVITTEMPKTTQETTTSSTTSTTTKPNTTAPLTTVAVSTTSMNTKPTTLAPVTNVAANITTTAEPKSNIATITETITTTETDEDVKTTVITTTQETPTKRSKRSVVKYKAPSEFHPAQEPLRLKDFVLGKRITKSYPRKKPISRGRREILPWLNDPSFSLKNLDVLRTRADANRLANPGLFVDKVIHKIDLTINERGTEGGAATVATIRRSGTDVVMRVDTPFMFLIRHDDTRLPLFYGAVYEPTNF